MCSFVSNFCRYDGTRIVFVWNFWSLKSILHNLIWSSPLCALYIACIECECTCVISTKCLTRSEILLLLFCVQFFPCSGSSMGSSKRIHQYKSQKVWYQKTKPLQDCMCYSSMGCHGSAAFKILDFHKMLTSVWCLSQLAYCIAFAAHYSKAGASRTFFS